MEFLIEILSDYDYIVGKGKFCMTSERNSYAYSMSVQLVSQVKPFIIGSAQEKGNDSITPVLTY